MDGVQWLIAVHEGNRHRSWNSTPFKQLVGGVMAENVLAWSPGYRRWRPLADQHQQNLVYSGFEQELLQSEGVHGRDAH